jgi:hypothetical protein
MRKPLLLESEVFMKFSSSRRAFSSKSIISQSSWFHLLGARRPYFNIIDSACPPTWLLLDQRILLRLRMVLTTRPFKSPFFILQSSARYFSRQYYFWPNDAFILLEGKYCASFHSGNWSNQMGRVEPCSFRQPFNF